MAGRICLVESLILGSLVHSMMVYRWPGSLLKELDSAIRNFLWTGDVSQRGNVMVAWSRCCAPKSKGGLGMKSLVTMKKAYLLRFTWDFLTKDSEFFSFIRGRYLENFLLPRVRYISSSIWGGLKEHISALTADSKWLIGDRSSVRFWLDNWLGFLIADKLDIPVEVRKFDTQPENHYYINGVWNFSPDFIIKCLDIVRLIVTTPIAPNSSDSRVWSKSLHGQVTSQLAYLHLRPSFPSVAWGEVDLGFLYPSSSLDLWRAIHNRLPTMDSIRRRGGPSISVLCFKNAETVDHIFSECSFTRTIWQRLSAVFRFHLDRGWAPPLSSCHANQAQSATLFLVESCFRFVCLAHLVSS